MSSASHLKVLRSALDALVSHGIERDISLRPILEVDAAQAAGSEALRQQLLLIQLESSSNVERGHDAQEHRLGVVRQSRGKVPTEGRKIEPRRDDDGGHPRLTVGSRHLDTVYGCIADPGGGPDDAGYFGGRNVLPLPPERVANPVDEIEKPLRVAAHQIPGPVPGIPVTEYIAQDLAARGHLIGVALVAAQLPAARRLQLADGFARLIGLTGRAVT